MTDHVCFIIVFAAWMVFAFAAAAVFTVFNRKIPTLATALPRERKAGLLLTAILLAALVPHVEELFEPQSVFVQNYLLWIAAVVLFICIMLYADYIFARAIAVTLIFGAYLVLREGFGTNPPLYPLAAVCAFLTGLTGIVIGAKPVWLRAWLENAREKPWLRCVSAVGWGLTGLVALTVLLLNEIC